MTSEVLDAIRDFMRDKGLNQEQFAELIHASKSAVSKWLSHRDGAGVDRRIWMNIEEVCREYLPERFRIRVVAPNAGVAVGRDVNGDITQNSAPPNIDGYIRILQKLLLESDMDKATRTEVLGHIEEAERLYKESMKEAAETTSPR